MYSTCTWKYMITVIILVGSVAQANFTESNVEHTSNSLQKHVEYFNKTCGNTTDAQLEASGRNYSGCKPKISYSSQTELVVTIVYLVVILVLILLLNITLLTVIIADEELHTRYVVNLL